MKSFLLSIAIVYLALPSPPQADATCSKTSAFRYEFEAWFRRYWLEAIGNITEGIEITYKIALSELELEKAQEESFQKSLDTWHNFYSQKIAATKHELPEIAKEFRVKSQSFELEKNMLGAMATKNLMKALDDLENVTEQVSRKYAEEIFEDWQQYYKSQDFETLAQQKDCNLIKTLIEHLKQSEQKTEALSKMSKELFKIFDMEAWINLLNILLVEK